MGKEEARTLNQGLKKKLTRKLDTLIAHAKRSAVDGGLASHAQKATQNRRGKGKLFILGPMPVHQNNSTFAKDLYKRPDPAVGSGHHHSAPRCNRPGHQRSFYIPYTSTKVLILANGCHAMQTRTPSLHGVTTVSQDQSQV